MTRYEIRYVEDRCTGCLRCQLACSELHTGAFRPEAALLRVVGGPAAWTLRIEEACNGCGLCADSCFYGALGKERVKEGT